MTTLVEELKDEERIKELARMLGGGGLDSAITFKHAQELIKFHKDSTPHSSPQQPL